MFLASEYRSDLTLQWLGIQDYDTIPSQDTGLMIFLLGEGQSMGGCFRHVMRPFFATMALVLIRKLKNDLIYAGMH